MPEPDERDFDEEFMQSIVAWRERHRLREDEAVLLLVELFRIHQRHWDEIRLRELPSFEQFRADIAKLWGRRIDDLDLALDLDAFKACRIMWGRCREFCSTTDSTDTTESRVTLAHCAEFPDVEWFQDLKILRRDPLAQFSCYLSEAQTTTVAVRIELLGNPYAESGTHRPSDRPGIDIAGPPGALHASSSTRATPRLSADNRFIPPQLQGSGENATAAGTSRPCVTRDPRR